MSEDKEVYVTSYNSARTSYPNTGFSGLKHIELSCGHCVPYGSNYCCYCGKRIKQEK